MDILTQCFPLTQKFQRFNMAMPLLEKAVANQVVVLSLGQEPPQGWPKRIRWYRAIKRITMKHGKGMQGIADGALTHAEVSA